MTEMIATSVEEQSCVSNEISKNVTEINDVADENSITADEVSTASKDMNSIADTLNQLTIQFKTT
jgi:methyl-accepting chemotaxis protein